MQSGDLERAEVYLNMACDFYRRSEMVPYLVRSLPYLAQLLKGQQRFAEAQEIWAEVENTKLRLR